MLREPADGSCSLMCRSALHIRVAERMFTASHTPMTPPSAWPACRGLLALQRPENPSTWGTPRLFERPLESASEGLE